MQNGNTHGQNTFKGKIHLQLLNGPLEVVRDKHTASKPPKGTLPVMPLALIP
jgi:hypothetical protein